MLHRSLAALMLAMTAPSIALADAAPPIPVDGYPPAIFSAWQSCTGDIEAFCPRIVPGGGRVVRCLIGHWPELTPHCRAGMLEARAALQH